jgi:hypothetical protein
LDDPTPLAFPPNLIILSSLYLFRHFKELSVSFESEVAESWRQIDGSGCDLVLQDLILGNRIWRLFSQLIGTMQSRF